jgi:hypothetical protein
MSTSVKFVRSSVQGCFAASVTHSDTDADVPAGSERCSKYANTRACFVRSGESALPSRHKYSRETINAFQFTNKYVKIKFTAYVQWIRSSSGSGLRHNRSEREMEIAGECKTARSLYQHVQCNWRHVFPFNTDTTASILTHWILFESFFKTQAMLTHARTSTRFLYSLNVIISRPIVQGNDWDWVISLMYSLPPDVCICKGQRSPRVILSSL